MNGEPGDPPKLRPNEPAPWVIWLGAVTGIAPALVGLLARQGNLALLLLAVNLTLWPLTALVLAIMRTTRRFGLGMLLGVGLVWLVTLAICGGLIRGF
jgi:hypothetical protein